jgi:hypothetical protein
LVSKVVPFNGGSMVSVGNCCGVGFGSIGTAAYKNSRMSTMINFDIFLLLVTNSLRPKYRK